MPLDLKKYTSDLVKMYYEDPGQAGNNVLVLGEYGSGKTFLLKTAKLPIHIDSFDPGGTKSIQELIDTGDAIVDATYESENPKDPKVYAEWYKEFLYRRREGYFGHFGTYVLDSSTNWSKSILGAFLQKNGSDPSALPSYKRHYHFQKFDILAYMRMILSLPCDSIVTGHLAKEKDEDSGKIYFRYLTVGDGAITIPLLFDEIWVMQNIPSGTGVNYRILTEATGQYQARSRLSQGGKLDTYEEPNIRAILRKCGLDSSNKPRLLSKEEFKDVRQTLLVPGKTTDGSADRPAGQSNSQA